MKQSDNKLRILAVQENLPKAMEFLEQILSEKKVGSKEKARTLLMAEETLGGLINSADPDAYLGISCSDFLGDITFKFKCKGSEFDVEAIENRLIFSDGTDADEEANEVIKNLIRRLFGDRYSVRSEKGTNKVGISVRKSPYRMLIITILSLVFGFAFGLGLKYLCPPDISVLVSDSVLTPIFNIFMNGLKMLVAPLVFFSIASSIAEFSDLRALGRIATKIVCMYVFTSMLAILVGLFCFHLFPIGHPSLAAAITDEAGDIVAATSGASISIIDTLVAIVPKDIITPFQSGDMLQVIFLGVALGITASGISDKEPMLRSIISVFNIAFSKITAWLVQFIPVIVFCSISKMVIKMELSDMGHLLLWIPESYFADVVMVCVYMLLLLLFTGLNPIIFLKKYYPAMFAAFTLSGSSLALPYSMKQCEELGVDKRVYSFSLPLGATINMDGSCVTLISTSLFMANIFDIQITGSVLFSLFVTIMLLSIGSPGVPGGCLVCITMLLPMIGAPAEAVSLVMGLYPIISMMQTLVNVTGDAVATTIVAKSEKMIQIEGNWK